MNLWVMNFNLGWFKRVRLSNFWAQLRIVVLCLSILAGSVSAASENTTSTEILSQALFAEIEHVSEQIVSRYPPNEYLYVGIGRSPTPILAYLEVTLGSQAVMHLPVGKVSLFTEDRPVYTEENRKILSEHLQSFIDLGVETGKKLLMIDFVFGGNSMVILQRELQRSPDYDKMTFLALKETHGVERMIELFRTHNIDNVPIPLHLERSLIASDFDKYAKYESYPVVDSAKGFMLPQVPVLNRKGYASLVKEVARRNSASMRLCNRIYKSPLFNF